ncbi:hypothetical protein X777_09421 [Ooceraea biroi]|nr:hypothetical protein X777_09421 [Ooceraea biroi]
MKKKTKKQENSTETTDLSKRLKEACNKGINDKDVPRVDGDDADDRDVKAPKKPSKRQLKKEKAVKVAIQKKQTSRMNAMQKALNYVSMWKHSRSEWKFEKLKQIWLMDNLLDNDSISDATFPIVLEYFEGCKGIAREVLLKKGMDVMRKAEEAENESNRIEIMESTAYKRARQLLQALPSDR